MSQYKRPPGITKKDIVWNDSENATATSSATHGLYGRQRHDEIGRYTGETHDGNSALCNKNYGISEDGSGFLSISEVENNSSYDRACRRCQKIFDKLPEQ